MEKMSTDEEKACRAIRPVEHGKRNHTGGLTIMNEARYAQIDNYLDLYCYAGRLNDTAWQLHILKRLKQIQESSSAYRQKARDLQRKFFEINRQIKMLCRRIRIHAIEPTDAIAGRLLALKQRRTEIGRELEKLKQKQQSCKQ
ncbi:MAG: hypothetical protein LKI94_01665 [Sporolactobacillus sp.]|nr:hypothetical protein [Sporolactobacillus sp.]